MLNDIILTKEYPSVIAQQLLDNEIDIGLVPVAVIPKLSQHYIVTDFCIGAVGEVASVCLFSDVPLHEIETVLLDYQSRTSVALTRVLLKNYWKINPQLVPATAGFQSQITGSTAGVVIGDRAFKQRLTSKYIYDLSSAWHDYTGLPFVFAAWVANKVLPATFVAAFNSANGEGFNHLPEIAAENDCPDYDLYTYYTENIDYTLTDEKRRGLERFLQELSAL